MSSTNKPSISNTLNNGISEQLTDSALIHSVSFQDDADGPQIECRIWSRGPKPMVEIDAHFLTLWETHQADGEVEERPGQFVRCRHMPGQLIGYHPGRRPAAFLRKDQPLIVCSIPQRFLHDLELELDRRPKGEFQRVRYKYDRPTSALMRALVGRKEETSDLDALRVQSLFTGIATRFLFLSRSQPQERVEPQTLPKHILKRVLERMNDELDTDLSLAALSTESGYSRAHFMRMFKASIGETPHSYLSELRLKRAQRLITDRSTRMIDVAMSCGFRSHSHFTVAFKRRFGLSPSRYRKGLYRTIAS